MSDINDPADEARKVTELKLDGSVSPQSSYFVQKDREEVLGAT